MRNVAEFKEVDPVVFLGGVFSQGGSMSEALRELKAIRLASGKWLELYSDVCPKGTDHVLVAARRLVKAVRALGKTEGEGAIRR